MAERKSPLAMSSRVLPKETPELSSTSQPKTPPAQVRTLFDWQVVRLKPLIEVPVRLVVEALVAKRLVVVAEVEVERVMLLKMCAPAQVGEKA